MLPTCYWAPGMRLCLNLMNLKFGCAPLFVVSVWGSGRKLRKHSRLCRPERHPMELLRHIINAFAMYDDRRKPQDEAHDREIAIDLVGLMIYFVALVQRHKEGLRSEEHTS